MKKESIFCLPQVRDAINAYYHSIGDIPNQVSFERIFSESGDIVLLVKSAFKGGHVKHLILKEYVKEWHQKEAYVYENLLTKNPDLGAPELIFRGKQFILLEYLDPVIFQQLSKDNESLLFEWLVEKHKHYGQVDLPDSLRVPRSVKITNLVEKPLNSLHLINQLGKTYIPSLQLERMISLKNFYIDLISEDEERPQTLEHGDLKLQNIFVDNQSRTLRVIDWVNTRRGSGVLDLNQYFDILTLLGGFDKGKEIHKLEEYFQIPDLEIAMLKIKILMLLNQIHFYFDIASSAEYTMPNNSIDSMKFVNSGLDDLGSILFNSRLNHLL